MEIIVTYEGKLLGKIEGVVLEGEDKPHAVKRTLEDKYSAVAAKIFLLESGQFLAEITCSVENLQHRGLTPVLQYDKVCGAVVFRKGEPRRYIIIKNLSGHIGFPKGHCENMETEEMTAIREVKEETGLDIQLLPDFRCEAHYTAEVDGALIDKTAVYFLAAVNEESITIQKEEIPDWWTLTYKEALEKLNFESDRNILRRAQYYCI